jgi:hypothetical protein
MSATSSISLDSDILNPNIGEYLIQSNIELKPNMEHVNRVIESAKELLEFFQNANSTMHFFTTNYGSSPTSSSSQVCKGQVLPY